MDRRTHYLWRKAAAEFLFPRRLCACCGAESPGDILCPSCRRQMLTLRPCPGCATFIAGTEPPDYRCKDCRESPPPFRLARAALPYEGKLRQRLLAFKYQEDTGQRRYLAPLLIETYRRWYGDLPIDGVVPVPLAAQRLEARGYNQAELLTDLLSAELALPHLPGLLRRVKDTRRLADLSRSEREKELRGAFQAEPDCRGRTLLLVDDIYTSGATTSAASRALLRAGGAEVYVLTVAAGWDLEAKKNQPSQKENHNERRAL